MNIIGAGLSGLIAAAIWPQAQVYEISAVPMAQHKALLRFRSEAVAQATGIEFKRVKVRKGIWHHSNYVQPSIQVANAYSQKCLGGIHAERSIWNIEPAERFIAPDNLYEQLVDNCGARINWGVDYEFGEEGAISTIPLPVLMKKLNHPIPNGIEFNRSPITVQRYTVQDCEAYQTVYFPSPLHSVYRASITGNLLIVEHAGEPRGEWITEVRAAFSLGPIDPTSMGQVKQSYGKIAAIDDSVRKQLLFDLTHKGGIYSLGRFATWKNILLDDVVHDAAVIKRLMRTGSHYDTHKELR